MCREISKPLQTMWSLGKASGRMYKVEKWELVAKQWERKVPLGIKRPGKAVIEICYDMWVLRDFFEPKWKSKQNPQERNRKTRKIKNSPQNPHISFSKETWRGKRRNKY